MEIRNNNKIRLTGISLLLAIVMVAGTMGRYDNWAYSAAWQRVLVVNSATWLMTTIIGFFALYLGFQRNQLAAKSRQWSYYARIISFFSFFGCLSLLADLTLAGEVFSRLKLGRAFSFVFQISNPSFALFWLLLLAPWAAQILTRFAHRSYWIDLSYWVVGILLAALWLTRANGVHDVNYLYLPWLLGLFAAADWLPTWTTKRSFLVWGAFSLISLLSWSVGSVLWVKFGGQHLWLPYRVHPFAGLSSGMVLFTGIVWPQARKAHDLRLALLPSQVAIAAVVMGSLDAGISWDWWNHVWTLNSIFSAPLFTAMVELGLAVGLTALVILIVVGCYHQAYYAFKNHDYNSWWLPSTWCWLLIPLSFFLLQGSTNLFIFTRLVAPNKPLLFLANLLVLLGLYVLFAALTNRVYWTLGLYTIMMVIAIMANYEKSVARNEPIVPLDTQNIVILPELLKMIPVSTLILASGAIILMLVFIGWFQWRVGREGRISWWGRLLLAIFSVGQLAVWINLLPTDSVEWSPSNTAHVSSNPFLRYLGYRNLNIIVPATHYTNNGSLIGFLSMVKVTVMSQPKNYSAASMAKIRQRYQRLAKQLNEQRKQKLNQQTVIFVLSESLANPDRIPGVTLKQSALPYLDQVKSNSTSGLLDSLGYGGGTANIEFEALTSLSMANFAPTMTVPYSFLVPKMSFVPTILSSYTTKNAVHPYSALSYARNVAYKKMGFQQFYAQTSGTKVVKYQTHLENNPYVDDQASFKNVTYLLKKYHQPQFIQLATMQNHMPYLSTYYQKQWPMTTTLTPSSQASLQAYTTGIHYSDVALKTFLTTISHMKRHITVVFYGDHLPGIYNWATQNSAKLKKYDAVLHQSDYFIYSNFKTQKLTKTVASPNMLAPLMLAQTKSKVSPYYALLTQIVKTPAYERNRYMNSQGKYESAKHLTAKQKAILRDYQLVQYDLTAGKNYLTKSFYRMP